MSNGPGHELDAATATFSYLGDHMGNALVVAAPLPHLAHERRYTARITIPHPGGGELTRIAEGVGRTGAINGALRLIFAAVKQYHEDVADPSRRRARAQEALFA